jgi:hypothetical protein
VRRVGSELMSRNLDPGGGRFLKDSIGPAFAIVDRYERRALTCRKFAIRAFDEAYAATSANNVYYRRNLDTACGPQSFS